MLLLSIQHFNSGFRTCDIIFSKEANSFHWVCLFCIFVRNKIYVMEIEMLKPVVLARYLLPEHKFPKHYILYLIIDMNI
jgi:hypothetical protein